VGGGGEPPATVCKRITCSIPPLGPQWRELRTPVPLIAIAQVGNLFSAMGDPWIADYRR
jgi:hypothetical protein